MCSRPFETRSRPRFLAATLATLPSMSLFPKAPFDLSVLPIYVARAPAAPFSPLPTAALPSMSLSPNAPFPHSRRVLCRRSRQLHSFLNAAHLMTSPNSVIRKHTRRDFISIAGKSLGLAALSSAAVASLLRNIEAASKNVAHLTPEEAAMDEDYWATIQNSFSVTRGIINLNNGGVSPSPRIVTEALVRYIWDQEDATA